VLDGVVLPKAPEAILAEKNFNTVPYIVGINKQEFGWTLPMVILNITVIQMTFPLYQLFIQPVHS
jgi:carboxylesterase 1